MNDSVHWHNATFGELLDITTGKLDSNEAHENGIYPFFTCSPQTLKINTFVFDKEAVILAGNNANGIFSVKYYEGKFNAYQRTYVISPKKNAQLSCRYCYYQIHLLTNLLREISIGTATRFLTLGILNKLIMPVPPLPEQQAIAHILGTLDDKIELNRRMNKTLESIARAIFKSWFIDFEPIPGLGPHKEWEDSVLGKIPIGWQVLRIHEIADRVGMGPFGSSIKVETFVKEGVPIISGQHLRGFMVEDKDFNFITVEHAEKLKNSIVRRGDIVFTHAGNIGQVAFIPENSEFTNYIISQRQFFMRCNPELVTPSFVTYYFQSPEGQHNLLANTSSSGVPSISRPVTYLRNIQVAIPPKSFLDAFEDIVRPVHRHINNSIKQSKILSDLRDTLLPKLLSGEIRIKDAEKTASQAV